MIATLTSLLFLSLIDERLQSGSALNHIHAGCFQTQSVNQARSYFRSHGFSEAEDKKLEEVNKAARTAMPAWEAAMFELDSQDQFLQVFIATNIGDSRFGVARSVSCDLWEHGAAESFDRDRISGFFGNRPFDTWKNGGRVYARWLRDSDQGEEELIASYRPCDRVAPDVFCGNSYSYEQTKAVD